MRKPKVITVIIVLFITLFAVLIGYTVLDSGGGQPVPVAAAPSMTPNTQRTGTQGAGGGAPGGGAQGVAQSAARSTQGNAQGTAGNAARNAIVVQATAVKPGTIENSVVINGDVLARNQVSIFPTVGGRLASARIGIGDRVNRGDIVAMVDPSRPGEVYSHSPVIATIAGTVLQSPYSIGDTVSTQSALFVVGDLSSLRVETFVPERFVSSIRQGLTAAVRLESIPGETFRAEVDEVSPVLDPASRTLRIRLRFAKMDSRIKAGMFATISLITQTRADVPVIPRSSVINTYGSWIVFTVDANSIAHRQEVELGLESEDLFEVISGVKPGDRIVSAGQNFLSDGDPVRVVE